MRRLRPLLVLATLLLVLGLSAPGFVRALLRDWESNPILRGRQVAERAGCPACHLPFAGDEIPNPGSRWQSVPAFQSGNPLMYGSTTRAGIEDYVCHGAPRKWLDDPKIVQRLDEQRLRMPAYEGVLSDEEIQDVVTWAAALEGVEYPAGEDGDVGAGRALAREHGCLSCHGLEGSGGLPNPGSLGGFIPGFLGRNFDDLVESREEFTEWIRDGRVERLAANPLVRRFWERQSISMPAYGDALSDEEVAQLWAWVQAARRGTQS